MKSIVVLECDPLYNNVLNTFISSNLVDNKYRLYSRKSPVEFTPNEVRNFFSELEKQFKNQKITTRKNMCICFLLSRFFLKNFSFFMRARLIIFGKYRIYNLKSFLYNFRNIVSLRVILLAFVFFLGLLRFPVSMFTKILFLGFKDLEILQEKLDCLGENIFVFATNGLDNLYFLLIMLKKPKHIRYLSVTYSWDNISSKFILSKKLDHVALWNHTQKKELRDIYGYDIVDSTVIGSKMADRSYAFYAKQKVENQSDLNQHTLAILGLFNKSDEFFDVLRIHNLIQSTNNFWYKKIVYRPHPLSTANQKQIDFDKAFHLGIEINQDHSFDLNKFGGIICFPTSIIFEVLVSGVPSILYAPRYSKYRTDPANVLKYKHFEAFRSLKPFPIIGKFEDLKSMLMNPIRTPKKLSIEQVNDIFPRFTTNYNSRLTSIIKNL